MAAISAASSASVGHYANPLRLVRGLWQHRELIAQFTRRDITQRYQGIYLGVCWAFLQPLLMLGSYTFVFWRFPP